MKKYIIKRLLIAIPTLIGITLIDYAIMCFAGSPLEMLQGARISQEAVAAKEAALGLDKPFYVQYFIWLGQVLKGNLGVSIKTYQPVSQMIMERLGAHPVTDGSFTGSEPSYQYPCGNIQRSAPVFQRRLCGGNSVLFKQQHPGIFSLPSSGLHF